MQNLLIKCDDLLFSAIFSSNKKNLAIDQDEQQKNSKKQWQLKHYCPLDWPILDTKTWITNKQKGLLIKMQPTAPRIKSEKIETSGSTYLNIKLIKGHDRPKVEEGEVEVVLEQFQDVVVSIFPLAVFQSKAHTADYCKPAASIEKNTPQLKVSLHKTCLHVKHSDTM